jgi:hypothetical protein
MRAWCAVRPGMSRGMRYHSVDPCAHQGAFRLMMLVVRMTSSEEGSDNLMVCSASWSSRWHAASQ